MAGKKEHGFVLVAGVLLLTLAGLLSLSAWHSTQLSLRTAVNYQERFLAKEAAYVALRDAENKLQTVLNGPEFWDTSVAPHRFVMKTALLIGCNKPPHFFVDYIGQEKDPERFFFRITATGWSGTGDSHQVLDAYYRFKQVGQGNMEGTRHALYLF